MLFRSNNQISHNNVLPQIVSTSSGDTILNIADPTTPDRWVTFGGPLDQDPFTPDGLAETLIPTVADVALAHDMLEKPPLGQANLMSFELRPAAELRGGLRHTFR